MKTRFFAVMAIVGLSLLANACVVRSIITDLSPSVIGSDINAEVKRNEAVKAKFASDEQGQKLSQETAVLWNEIAKKELRAKLNPETVKPEDEQASKNYTIGPDGVVGGLPCQFVNDSQRNKTLLLTKEGGLLAGYKFSFDMIKQGGQKKYKLLPGVYAIAWTTEYDNNIYRPGSGERLTVTLNPKLYDDRTGEQYHGRVRLFGY